MLMTMKSIAFEPEIRKLDTVQALMAVRQRFGSFRADTRVSFRTSWQGR